ncbi:MAG: hypothetical protein NZO16_01675 [Deltaproteobacteria bacterium]|nr:hypothetical protein [Deltaproteobacteria bacterium]
MWLYSNSPHPTHENRLIEEVLRSVSERLGCKSRLVLETTDNENEPRMTVNQENQAIIVQVPAAILSIAFLYDDAEGFLQYAILKTFLCWLHQRLKLSQEHFDSDLISFGCCDRFFSDQELNFLFHDLARELGFYVPLDSLSKSTEQFIEESYPLQSELCLNQAHLVIVDSTLDPLCGFQRHQPDVIILADPLYAYLRDCATLKYFFRLVNRANSNQQTRNTLGESLRPSALNKAMEYFPYLSQNNHDPLPRVVDYLEAFCALTYMFYKSPRYHSLRGLIDLLSSLCCIRELGHTAFRSLLRCRFNEVDHLYVALFIFFIWLVHKNCNVVLENQTLVEGRKSLIEGCSALYDHFYGRVIKNDSPDRFVRHTLELLRFIKSL